jgi:hypothetical protein
MINLVNKDDPNYRPNYGSTYTKRQMDVLAGIIPLEFVPINTKANRITKKTTGESAPVSAVLYSAWTFFIFIRPHSQTPCSHQDASAYLCARQAVL